MDPRVGPSFPGCPPDVTPTPGFEPASIKREALDESPWQYLVKTALFRTSVRDNNLLLQALLVEVSEVLKQFKLLAEKTMTVQQPGGGVALDPFPPGQSRSGHGT